MRLFLFATSIVLVSSVLRADVRGEADIQVLAQSDEAEASILATANSYLAEIRSKNNSPDLLRSHCSIVIHADFCDQPTLGWTSYRTDAQGHPRAVRIELKGKLRDILNDELPRQLRQIALADQIGVPPRWAEMGFGLLAESSSNREQNWQALRKYRDAGTLISIGDLLSYEEYPKDQEVKNRLYVQSMAFVTFLEEKYERTTILQFVATANKHVAEGAAIRPLGYATLGELDLAFRKWLAEK